MSGPDFDSTFDYTKAITRLTAANTTDQASIAAIQAELDDYAAAGNDWASVTGSRITQLNGEIARVSGIVTLRSEVLAEIAAITALSPANKATLFTIFGAVGDTAPAFMVRMLFNVQAALADPDVIRLEADVGMPLPVKIRLAKLLYAKYPLNRQHALQLAEAQRYLLLP